MSCSGQLKSSTAVQEVDIGNIESGSGDTERESEDVEMSRDPENVIQAKVSLLETEEKEEKLKMNLLLTNEKKSLLALENEAKITKLEKVALEVELKEIEGALDELLRRKSSIAEKQKAAETKVASIEEEQTILKLNVATQVNESEAKIARIQNEIKTAEMGKPGGGSKLENTGNRELEIFLEDQILELEGELECPVCLEVATTSPIYKCIDDHLLCRFLLRIYCDICTLMYLASPYP